VIFRRNFSHCRQIFFQRHFVVAWRVARSEHTLQTTDKSHANFYRATHTQRIGLCIQRDSVARYRLRLGVWLSVCHKSVSYRDAWTYTQLIFSTDTISSAYPTTSPTCCSGIRAWWYFPLEPWRYRLSTNQLFHRRTRASYVYNRCLA